MRCCYALSCLEHVTETPGQTPDETAHLMTQAFTFVEFSKFTGIKCAKVHTHSSALCHALSSKYVHK